MRTMSTDGKNAADELCHDDFIFGRRAEAEAIFRRFDDCLADHRMIMPQYHRPPRSRHNRYTRSPSSSVMTAPSPLLINRGVPPTDKKGAHRAVDTTRHDLFSRVQTVLQNGSSYASFPDIPGNLRCVICNEHVSTGTVYRR